MTAEQDPQDEGELPWVYGPIANPVERFAHLPKETRRFLEQLRKEDIDELNDAVKFYRTARSVGKFNAWLFGGVVGMVIAFAALGDSIRKIFGFIK